MYSSHCNLLENKKADEIAKQGTLLEQADTTTSFAEQKRFSKEKLNKNRRKSIKTIIKMNHASLGKNKSLYSY